MAESTKSIRIDSATLRLVKSAAARAGESMQAWLHRACHQRLETEKTPPADKQRVVSAQFEE